MFQTEDIQGNRHTTRGVLDTAIIGDSGTGKSNTGVRFMKVYGTGVSQEFSKATVKGLIGGSDVGNKNKINPGILPQNDKALVILDELSGMDGSETRRNIFAEMLDIRSKGSVLVTRVSDKVELTAHVRLIMFQTQLMEREMPLDLRNIKELHSGQQ